MGEIEEDELISMLQGTQPNNRNHFNNNSGINYNDQGQGQNSNFHSYESPSSTTTSMEQKLEQVTPNTQHFRLNTTGQFQQINREQGFTNQIKSNI